MAKHESAHVGFQQAAALFAQGRAQEAAPLLQQLVAEGDSEAQNLLGVMHLNGLTVEQDAARAAELFQMAAIAGLKEGHFNLSNLLYNGIGLSRDYARGQEHLLAAARAGHRPSLRGLGYVYHFMGPAGDWPRLATHCFQLAAQAGDPLSKYALGLRHARGDGAATDANAAAYWFNAAAVDRVHLAGQRLAELGIATPAAPQVTRDAVMELPTCTLPSLPTPKPVRHEAFMSEYRHTLDPYICDHFMNMAAPRLAPSGVVDPRTGAALQSRLRTSYSMYYQPSMYDVVTARALEAIAAVAGLPSAHAEPLGVLRYGPGQEYQPHYDYYNDDQHEAQRVTTVFVYLNDVEEGGGTDFPRLGVAVQPEQGKAVKFLNCDERGRPNPETLHAGLPVVRGEKWLATLWFWDRPFPWFT